MRRYFIRRLLLVAPTLLLISLLLFGLSELAGDDEELIRASLGDLPVQPARQQAMLERAAADLGLDLPAFYWSVSDAATPSALYRIFPAEKRRRVRLLSRQSGLPDSVLTFEARWDSVLRAAYDLPDSMRTARAALLACHDRLQRIQRVEDLHTLLLQTPFPFFLEKEKNALARLARTLSSRPRPALRFVPRWTWHGAQCKYHRRLSGLFTGDLGMSLYFRKPVWEVLKPRLYSTLALNGMAIGAAILPAILLGLWMARRRGSWPERLAGGLLPALYAMPTFWIGLLLILFVATPGMGLHWVKGVSVQPWRMGLESYWQWFGRYADKIILAGAAIWLHLLALLALHLRSGALEVMRQDYVLAARARGLSEGRVSLRYLAPNALFPLIGLLAATLPALISGSVVIEYLFGYPGMGALTHQAFLQRDHPLLFGIVLPAAGVAVLAQLLADMLYARIDPRIRYGDK
ncbi:MAG: ABC transporter permease [Saprospiraceae bacterium]